MDTRFTVNDCIIMEIPTFTDERGTINVLDKELPFNVMRVFWLHHIIEGRDRGGHALMNSSEILVAIHGSFVVDVDDTENKTSIMLDDPSKGLIIRPGIWFRTHSYKADGVSLILAEQEYARDMYTYNYEEYKRLKVGKK